MPEFEKQEDVLEETPEVEEGQVEETEDLVDEEVGEPVTFEDIINHPDYQSEYRKAIDREVSKAIKSYQKNHQTDVEKIVGEKVAEQVREVKFNASLKEKLHDAGVIDTTAFIAHLDLDTMRESYDDESEEFNGFAEMISQAKEDMPYLFKQENTVSTTGQAQNKFGSNKPEIKDLKSALKAKYNIK